MAIKIGKWYITRNNPREILRISANKQNIIDEVEEEIDYLLQRQYESEKFAKEQGFNTYLPAKVNLEYLKNKLQELKEKYDEE